MKRFECKSKIRLLLPIIGIVFITASLADFSKETKMMMKNHKKFELEFSSVPLIKRIKQNSRDKKIAELLETVNGVTGLTNAYDIEEIKEKRKKQKLIHKISEEKETPVTEEEERENFEKSQNTHKDLEVIESEDATTIIQPDEFQLRVLNKGNAFRLRNLKNHYGKFKNKPYKLSEDKAEKLGKEIIKHFKLVPAKELNQLHFIKTKYTHFTGKVADPGDRIISTIAHFGRKINGVPVVGYKGSSVVIELISEGAINHSGSYISQFKKNKKYTNIHAIAVDWCPIEILEEYQKSVDKYTYENRIKGLHALDGSDTPISNYAEILPYEKDIEIKNQICGYVDMGASRGDSEYMQLGCMVIKKSTVSFIPIGETVINEKSWKVTNKIKEIDEIGKKTKVKIKYID